MKLKKKVFEEFGKYWIDLAKVVVIVGIIYPIFKEGMDLRIIVTAIIVSMLLLSFGLYWINRGGA